MSRSRREGRGEGGFHHRHYGGGYSRGGRRRGIGSNHRGLSKRRRFDKMEEDHVIDTYDAEDGNVHVVNDVAADNDRIATHEATDTSSNSSENETSPSECEREDAFCDLLNELTGKLRAQNSKHSFLNSDEDDEGDSDNGDEHSTNYQNESAEDESADEKAEEDDQETDSDEKEDENHSGYGKASYEMGAMTSKANGAEAKDHRGDINDAGDREHTSDEDAEAENDNELDGESSSDEEEGCTNYISHLEWIPDEKYFPPEPYSLQPGSLQQWPQLGVVKIQPPQKNSKNAPEIAFKQNTKISLKKVLADNLEDVLDVYSSFKGEANVKMTLDAYEESVLNVLNSYRDFYYPEHRWEKAESLRLCYTLHVMNHVLRSRARTVKHSTKIRRSDGAIEYQDQGLTRVKALIVLPFKNAAYRVIKLILKMVREIKLQILNENRFEEEFRPPDDNDSRRGNKPDDFYKFFDGDNDDMFRIGLRFTKRRVQLYANFYSADLIIASPVGLRAIIGSEGDEKRDYDFLSSIEIVVLDQTDVFFMQNWEHVVDLFKHLNIKPRKPHGVDFSRVRIWCVSEWGKYFRQNIVISQVQHPQINALMKRYNFNYRGLVSVCNPVGTSVIAQVVVQIPHIFRSFEPASAGVTSDSRFEFFINEILPQLRKDKLVSHCMIYVRQYFDFVRLRNYMRDLADRDPGFKFSQICEYTEDGKVAKARYMFFHGKRKFLLYTERFHFFHRYTIKGVRHIIFYELPIYPHFYSELINMMSPANQYKLTNGMDSTFTATTLYCKYDALALLPILNEQRTGSVVYKRDKKVHVFSRD
ncbi:digestive organ expansion factor homolog [Varroa destructor]|uniref:Digestive organ expansion factor n=1 Tax=Varroa destructor TaxID=109461 RepID=A0A7M7ME72_VARDE|nr:digestive organ expansion factor homolog [Varroa destructor]XP_022655485.1 digestive organ expansion factor homolog [Varroa destructor]